MDHFSRSNSRHTNNAAMDAGLKVLRRGHRRMIMGVAVIAVALPAPVLGGVFFGQEGFVMGCGLQLLLLVLCAANTGGFRRGGRWA